MRNQHGIIHQDDYRNYRKETAEWVKNAYKKALSTGEAQKLNEIVAEDLLANEILSLGGHVSRKAVEQQRSREGYAKGMIKSVFEGVHAPKMDGLMKAGVTTALGQNFYDLRAPVLLLYPVNTPIRNEMPRKDRVNDGYGTAAHWMATKNPGIGYAGVSEGNRNAAQTPDNNNYTVAYKGLGMERSVTFESQWGAEGFADELADEHLRGLQSIFLQEEAMMLLGNAGTGGLGFALGTAPTPTTATAATHTVGAAGNLSSNGSDLPYTTQFTTSDYVSVACVLLSAMGNPNNAQYGYLGLPTIAAGLSPVSTRTNADGSQDTINGGTSAISLISNVTQAATSNLTIKATVANYPKGTFGFAWFVDVQASSTGSVAAAKFAGITSTPFAYISGTPTGTQLGNATGLSADHSSNSLDFDGLLTMAATQGAYWKDLGGTALTSESNGRVTEIETALQTIFDTYQSGVDEMWVSSDAAVALDKAIRYNAGAGTAASGMIMTFTRDGQNNLTGGYVISGYQSRYAISNPMGANVIPMRIHPMMPRGTVFFNIKTNPYPHSRMPFVYGMLTRRNYYSIEWPVTSRKWTFGTYVDEVIQHNAPWLCGVLKGIV